jgi:hypothetical protein
MHNTFANVLGVGKIGLKNLPPGPRIRGGANKWFYKAPFDLRRSRSFIEYHNHGIMAIHGRSLAIEASLLQTVYSKHSFIYFNTVARHK